MRRKEFLIFLNVIGIATLIIATVFIINKLKEMNTEYEYVTVVFESNGGTPVEPIKVIKGNRIKAPTPPIKEGSIFAGWFKDKNLQNEWFFGVDIVGNDITLYAKFESEVPKQQE